MKKLSTTVLVLVLCVACACEGKKKAAKSDSEAFIDHEMAKIRTAKMQLAKLGHMDEDYVSDYTVLGSYDWHGGRDGGYFGAYSFSQPAFEQAKRGWFLRSGRVVEGNNELWTSSQTIKFDNSVIGYKLPGLYMSWYESGKYRGEYFTAKIIGVKDEGRTLILDKRAPHHAEQWGVNILPDSWADLCNCTNNFHPRPKKIRN